MLTGITNYLFGAPAEDVEERQPRLKTRPTENNEWVLVDKASRDTSPEKSPNSVRFAQCLQSVDQSNPRVPHPHPTDCRNPSPHEHSSDSGSDVCTLPDHIAQDESWLVTPPPCFTAGGHSAHRVEDNPMENLLIEHPSMSVYGPRGRQSSTGVESEHSESESSNEVEMAAVENSAGTSHSRRLVEHQPPRRPRAVAARAGLIVHVQKVRSAQVAQQRYNTRSNARGKLQRHNKVREFQSRNMRPRRKDHGNLPSGRSNNRRC